MDWLQSQVIEEALQHTLDRQFVDLDPVFNHNLDDDYDFRSAGITRGSFWTVYGEWIQFCCEKRKQQINSEKTSPKKMKNANSVTEKEKETPANNNLNTVNKSCNTSNNNSTNANTGNTEANNVAPTSSVKSNNNNNINNNNNSNINNNININSVRINIFLFL